MASPPFWIVTHRRGGEETGVVVGFGTKQAISQYLEFPRIDVCTVYLIGEDAELMLLVADLHRIGITQIRFNPDPDGSGGELILLNELFRHKPSS